MGRLHLIMIDDLAKSHPLSAISHLPSAMIQVHVKLYASLRRYRPDLPIGQAFECAAPHGITVGELVDGVLRLPASEVAIVLVNGVHSDRERLLSDGDQVALWPPIAGGSDD